MWFLIQALVCGDAAAHQIGRDAVGTMALQAAGAPGDVLSGDRDRAPGVRVDVRRHLADGKPGQRRNAGQADGDATDDPGART